MPRPLLRICLFLLFCASPLAHADIPGASPYFAIDSADPALDSLPLKSTQVEVKVLGMIADVRIVQRCFIADDGQSAQRVCEYIEDADGHGFSDQSAWYWAAQAGRSKGPWLAVTTARAVVPESL
ncbi:hypothetical protein [Pseudomonas sp. LRF_L74]|uniref:hypothetical protein n=1 Tax=Pseudomonas sp. LRF_L74 TaxID=3369422 RepID=UPI003F637554